MDNQRIFLWIALALVVWLNYTAFVQYQSQLPAATPSHEAVDETAAPGLPEPMPAPNLPTTEDIPAPPGVEGPLAAPVETAQPAERPIRVTTDVLEVEISPRGGDLVSAVLPEYPVHKNQPDVPIQLLDASPAALYVLRTGLTATVPDVSTRPDTLFVAPAMEFSLAPGEDMLEVPLTVQLDGGVTVKKIYRFRRGSYALELEQEVRNGRDEPWTGASYLQIRRLHDPPGRSLTNVESYSFRGPVTFNGEKYEKHDAGDLVGSRLEFTSDGGWIASIQHHFLAAAIPAGRAQFTAAAAPDGVYTLTAVGMPESVAPGASMTFRDQLFVGPKLQEQLEATAPRLRLTVDYGWLTVISQPLFWVLSKIHGLVGNWGWAIILMTVLIKAVFYKLSETSGKSMAKMRKLQPRMKALQERYADDRQKLSQAMMDLYKKEKVNPAAGCLPILVQMPVFLALYWVLLESVEMRQAPFMLWITDLSVRDPLFILPLLMGVTMFIQQKLNPAPPDPMQAKIMQFLPVIFTVFFAFFPAGLVLYWFVNNLLAITQQWHINKVVERGAA
ncbi:MAG TPA: membrane protein insertase YidC [Gammaproteobacteria bacterium]|nr:membrane protein insertase YidC [Gammaproteobacteria bacterium]